MASVKREPGVAFGNAIGSNILNILLILGIVAIIRPIETTGLRIFDIGALVASTLILFPLMMRGFVLNRWEGAFLVVAYAGYIYSVVR